jgi:hypothetical protein
MADMAIRFETNKARRSRKFRSVVLGGVSSIVLVAAPAVAAPQEEERHCVVHLVPVSPRTEDGVTTASLEEGGCFPTFEQALEAGTGGEIALPEGISPGELTQSLLEGSVTAASDVMIGTEYDSTGFLGASRNFFAASGCASTTWQVANVGATWNDRFESGKGFGTCDHNRKFQHENFGGPVVLCTPNCTTYGALRNEVTSLRWAD